MKKYIAMLRGINVGGNNTIAMPVLKELFEQNGFNDVKPYINSGNIIFSSENTDEMKLKEKCEIIILGKFNINISVMIISVDDLSEAVNNAPEWWGKDTESKHNTLFIVPPATVKEVFESVDSNKPEYERIDHFGRVIFWSAPILTYSITRLTKIVGASLYNSITIRNFNTVKKLVQLSK